MSVNIRRQSILSSLIIYLGFAIGFINTILLGKENLFSSEENGLVFLFAKVASLIASLASLAMPQYVLKFFPYYKNRIDKDKNDMLSIALTVATIGFGLLFTLGYVFEEVVIRKYSANSQLFVDYYYWVYLLGFGLTIFNILEAYCQSLQKPVITTFLKEAEWRLLTFILIILFATGFIKNFSVFIKAYALTYCAIALTLFIYLLKAGAINFTFKISFVTKRIRKILLRFTSFVYFAFIIATVSQVFDTLVIGSVVEDGLKNVAIFTLADFMTSVIQAPQRGAVNVAVAHLAEAWKEKDLPRIRKIYIRSSINLLLVSLFLFCLIALNFVDAVHFLKFKPEFAAGFVPFLFMGIARVIELGTGVNGQVIATSKYWRFELTSGIVLLLLLLPLTYFFTKNYGIIGPPVAGLISVIIYNGIRIYFLWSKFKLFPFSIKSVHNIILAGAAFGFTYFLFKNVDGFWALAGRTVVFSGIYAVGAYLLKISPDVQPVLNSLLKRVFKNKN